MAISKCGGVTKSRPVDPFFDVIYLFLNASFGQKVLYHLALFAVNSTFFYSIFLNFLTIFFFRTTPFFPSFYTPENFFHRLKNFPPHNFLLPTLSNFHFFGSSKNWGVLTPKIPPASAPLPLNLKQHPLNLHPINLELHPSTSAPSTSTSTSTSTP